jgi:hypothetical protein
MDPVWPRWLQQLREYILKLMPKPAYGAFADTTTQTAAANTATVITWNTTNYSSDVAINGTPSEFIFPTAGNYNMEFSLQFQNSGTAEDNVTVWVKINGVDVPESAGIGTVHPKHGSIPGALLLGWTELLTLAAGDTLKMYWTTDSGNSKLATYPVGTAPVHPKSPCAAVTFVQVT